jgi:hypothetical protein
MGLETTMSRRQDRKIRRFLRDLSIRRNSHIASVKVRCPESFSAEKLPPAEVDVLRAIWAKGGRIELNKSIVFRPDGWTDQQFAGLQELLNLDETNMLFTALDTEILAECQGDWSIPVSTDFNLVGTRLLMTFNRTWLGDIPLLEMLIHVDTEAMREAA